MDGLSRPIAKFLVSEPPAPVGQCDGFAQYDLVAELLARGQCSVNEVSAGPVGQGHYPAAMAVRRDPWRSVVARPLLDTGQGLGLGHFDIGGGNWIALHNHGLGNEVKLYQSDGTPNQITGLTSRFTLPANPVFCVSLYRAEPGPDYNWSVSPPYTELHFGVSSSDEWALAFPYGGPVSLLRNQQGEGWTRLSTSERTVHVPTLEGFARGQRMLLWVAVWSGAIVLSSDGFAGDVWAYELPGETICVPQGKLALWHNAGQAMISVFPVQMGTAVIDSPGIDAGYETRGCNGELILSTRHTPVIDSAGNVLSAAQVVDSTASRGDLPSTQRAWRATLQPWTHHESGVGTDPDTGQSVDFQTCVSPELYSVQIGQYPELTASGEESWSDLSDRLYEARSQSAAEPAEGRCGVALDGAAGAQGVRAWAPAKLELGWCENDGEATYQSQINGYVADARTITGPGGGCTTTATIVDPLVRLRDCKCDGRAPVFDGWPVTEVFRWALDRCGIGSDRRRIEDTGAVLSLGTPQRPLWRPALGRDWLEFLSEVAQFDHRAGIFCDPDGNIVKGCRYCRLLRTDGDVARHDGSSSGACPTQVDYHLYTRLAAAPDPGQPGDILSLVSAEHGAAGAASANCVVVEGVDANGDPVRGVAVDADAVYDPASPGYVGWRRMKALDLKGYTTQEDVSRVASELLGEYSDTAGYIIATVSMMPQVRVGQVVEVHGAEESGLDGHRYRVTSVSHHVRSDDDAPATTVIAGRWISDSTQ